ncbi:MAG: hypothetical protein RLZ13_2080 [Bacteroidota bacterium]|jgi:hypothetical protein
MFLLSWSSMQLAAAQEKGTVTQLELGLLGGKTKDLWEEKTSNRTTLSFTAFHGKEVFRNQNLGFFVGLDDYPSITLLPVGIGWRGFLGKKSKPQFFGSLDLGYGSTVLEKVERTDWSSTWYESGLVFRPAAGIKLPAKKGNWALTASLGYKRQPTYFFEGNHSQTETKPKIPLFRTRDALPKGFSSLNSTSTLYHSLSFQLGILF